MSWLIGAFDYIFCACATKYYAMEKLSDVSSCFRSHSSEPMKAKKIFAVPGHPIKIGPRAYDGSWLLHMVLCFTKLVDQAVCRGDFGERTLFLWLILVSIYTMNFARFQRRSYHSFQSMYQVSWKEGFPSFFRVLGRCIRGETTDYRAGKTQQHVGIFANEERDPVGDTKACKGKQYALFFH